MCDVNLLPHEKNWHFKLQALIFLLIVVLVLLLWHMNLQKKINILAGQVICLEKELTKTSKSSRGDVKSPQHARKNRFMQILQEILQGVPGGLNFTELQFESREVKIIGQTKSIADLAQFIKNLQHFEKNAPIIQKIDKQGVGYNFTMTWLCK